MLIEPRLPLLLAGHEGSFYAGSSHRSIKWSPESLATNYTSEVLWQAELSIVLYELLLPPQHSCNNVCSPEYLNTTIDPEHSSPQLCPITAQCRRQLRWSDVHCSEVTSPLTRSWFGPRSRSGAYCSWQHTEGRLSLTSPASPLSLWCVTQVWIFSYWQENKNSKTLSVLLYSFKGTVYVL